MTLNMASRIIGCGGYLPKHIMHNSDLEKIVETSDEWIRTRTGIGQRHIAEEGEYSSHMAFAAAQKAIKDAGIAPSDIDLVIVSTTTPDNSFPSTATKLQGYLNLGSVPSFDLQAVCAGFVYGLQVADSLLRSGLYKTILYVCSEKMSSLLDWTDRSTCVLFGDGAGAVVLQSSRSKDSSGLATGAPTASGIIDSKIYSDGSLFDILYTNGGVSSSGTAGKIQMQGPVLFKHAIDKMSSSVLEILAKNDLSVNDITHFIPHQANLRIIDSLAQRLEFDDDKIIKTVERHANCSAASIPLALAELKESGKIKAGDIILFTAIGAGLTWGSALLRW